MSAAAIERELNEYVATLGYEVRFELWRNFFWVTVVYEGRAVAQKTDKSYPRAARWAKRQVREHQKALAILGPLARPGAAG